MAILCWAAKNSLRGTVASLLRSRLGCVRFALNFFSLRSEIKWNWILFTCVSLFHYKISLLFFRFFSLTSLQIFASLHFSNFCFEVKQSQAKFKSIFLLFLLFFHYFHFFVFFAFFRFFCYFFALFRLKFFASLRFNNFCFDGKQCEAKFKSIFLVFLLFSLNFHFAAIFLLNFRLFNLCFRFRFLVFHIEVNHVKSGFFTLPS